MREACKGKSTQEAGRVGVGRIAIRSALLCLVSGLVTTHALAGPVQDYDFDWATIGDTNNSAFTGTHPFWPVYGRGSVSYRYRISKYEVTTAQWMEYVNTFSTQSDDNTFFARPSFWGARRDETYDGPGARFVLRETPNAANMPVFGLSWRESARYVNWLNNDKSASPDAITNGAYDTSTFGQNPDGTITDQRTRNADARFWIPTWDEWLKAAHYNPATDGWNVWPNIDDLEPVPGMPGVGTTSVGVMNGDCGGEVLRCPYDIALGAYDVTSTYGLYDLSGGTSEWTEEVFYDTVRGVEGLNAGAHIPDPESLTPDNIFDIGTDEPWGAGFHGLRIAGIIPTPGVCTPGLIMVLFQSKRRRRVAWPRRPRRGHDSCPA
jgi:sulfatase-modifying factor enzyme 1